jgi:hypothetical protein
MESYLTSDAGGATVIGSKGPDAAKAFERDYDVAVWLYDGLPAEAVDVVGGRRGRAPAQPAVSRGGHQFQVANTGDVRGKGLLCAIDLVRNKETKEAWGTEHPFSKASPSAARSRD